VSFYYKRLTEEDGTQDLHSVLDHELDLERSDRKAYVETMKRKHLVPLPGKRLPVYEVGPIGRRNYEYAEMEAGARAAQIGLTSNEAIGQLLAIILFDRCCIAAHDVWIDDDDAYGTVTGELLASTPQAVRREIGSYCIRLYGKVQPDFFGRLRSQRSAEEEGSEAKTDGPSTAATASDSKRTDENSAAMDSL
jgi:hypothetical protein